MYSVASHAQYPPIPQNSTYQVQGACITRKARRSSAAKASGCAETVRYSRLRGTAKGGAAGFAHLMMVRQKENAGKSDEGVALPE